MSSIKYFNDYNSVKQAVVSHLNNSDKHIVLKSETSNGKTSLIHELKSVITEKKFDVRLYDTIYMDLERIISESEYEYKLNGECQSDCESDYESDSDECNCQNCTHHEEECKNNGPRQLYLFNKSVIETHHFVDIPNSITYVLDYHFDRFGNTVRGEF